MVVLKATKSAEKIIESKAMKNFCAQWVNLAEQRLGARVLFASDDFFASKDNIIKAGRGLFIAGKYTSRGKWMDGWESRRKRGPGHDFLVLRLAARGVIKGVDIDTNHFTGNHPVQAALEACCLENGDPGESTQWHEILAKVDLSPGSQHLYALENSAQWTHIRLHIYPDGGVARLKIYGEVKKDWQKVGAHEVIDLIAVGNEGRALLCSDMYFSAMENLIAPGRIKNMGDGWETKRRRGAGHDWCVLKLGHRGVLQQIIVDTTYFKGNYPDRCSIEGVLAADQQNIGETLETLNWQEILPPTKLSPHQQHIFESHLVDIGAVNLLRLNIFPDGGIARLRAFGKIMRAQHG